VHELMEERYGTRPVAATESIEVVEAGEAESSILDVAPGAALLSITRVTTDEEGRPVEFSHDTVSRRPHPHVVHSPSGGTARSAQTRGGVVELRAQT
ncbi:MAG TPA: UTRA domain-containing protein, partial [Frankiaceae bacterium]|nr:UTRA domain-containing protein [Frankiaceae bacterium]